ncbi:glycosyltransferase family 32 protein [Segatella copri]|uniref:glycosyltransferase family 32 protein n=1 Tax=Segatella copri TaxID=165179 RepID=UPI003F891F23
MIPKIIHLCWMSGDPFPSDIQKCIDSWKRILPDYEIWLWDTKRFDLSTSVWVTEAYDKKKYAFCADYIRMYALFNYGGVYLDSDVEVLRSFNDLLTLPYFIGYESKQYFEAAVIGAEKGNPFIGDVLAYYKDRHFVKENGSLDIQIMPEVMMNVTNSKWKRVLINEISDFINDPTIINVFPYDWFSPIDSTGKRYVLRVSKNTYCIHHFASAWVDWRVKLLVKIFGYNSPLRNRIQRLGKSFLNFISNRK